MFLGNIPNLCAFLFNHKLNLTVHKDLLSERILLIEPSATSGISAEAKKLKLAGVDVINLSQGTPDFKTPEYICEAAKEAIDSGKYFSYPPTGGYGDLRTAIAKKYVRQNNVPYTAENIVVTNGAKQALSSTMLTMFNPNDEVIIFAPFWVSHLAQIKLTGATPIILKGKAKNDFKISIQQVKEVISEKTKAIVFSSPSNPTGLLYTKSELLKLATLVASFPNLIVIADEIYEHIRYTSAFTSFASLPNMFDRTITINGFSKAYAMAGWRVGYLAAPEWIAREVNKLQGHLSSANNSLAQRAALTALDDEKNAVKAMVNIYQDRRDLIYKKLVTISGLEVNLPVGAFYLFPKISSYYGTWFAGRQINNSTDICQYLLEVAHIAVVPGAAFGADEYIRICYTLPKAELHDAAERLKLALNNLKRR